MALVWAYHFQVIKSDIKLAGEAQIQAGLRRLYIYLIAAIGLSAFLVGISGILSVLIRSIDQTTFGTGLQQQLAWFAAVTIAGLPVWYLPWRQAQKTAHNGNPTISRAISEVIPVLLITPTKLSPPICAINHRNKFITAIVVIARPILQKPYT
ncbi:unnamed protein product [marine sediment metagenome]|uniref:DUF5671 domain-containing protein n=1 Tax=marine sediment metagenome TaxID=412755 RepID=X1BJ93_9ZZZZ